MDELSRIREACAYIRSICALPFEIGVVLGSGLGGFTDHVVVDKEIPYSDIPNFPVSTVEGHEGKLILGKMGTKTLL